MKFLLSSDWQFADYARLARITKVGRKWDGPALAKFQALDALVLLIKA